jgi:hypothetical protein
MKNPFPVIEGRTAEELKAEAIRRIKKMYPDWDIEDPSDVGNMLTEIFSWFAEMIAFKMNQIPEKLYENFIQMLGVSPGKAKPAETICQFRLKKDSLQIFSSLKENQFQNADGMPYRIHDPESLTPIRLERIFKIMEKNSNLIWQESEGGYYSARFGENEKIINQLLISFEEPLLKHLNLSVHFQILVPFQAKNEHSRKIIRDLFEKGEYFLEVSDEHAEVLLKNVEVEIKKDAIILQIPGGESEYAYSTGRIKCRKIFPVEELKKIDFKLGKASLTWNNELNPIRLDHYFENEDGVPQKFGESKIYFSKGNIATFKIPQAAKLPNSRIRFRVRIDSNPNKRRADSMFQWKIRQPDGRDFLFRPVSDQNESGTAGQMIDRTGQFHHSGTIDFFLPLSENPQNHSEEFLENDLMILMENSKDNLKYYDKEFKIQDIWVEFSGEKQYLEMMKVFFGKEEILDSKGKKEEVHINGKTYSIFRTGLYLNLDGQFLPNKPISGTFFLSVRENFSVEFVPEKMTIYVYQKNEWIPVTGKIEKIFPGYGLILNIRQFSLSKQKILGYDGFWILLPNELSDAVEDIYENCLICDQVEEIDKEYLGKLDPVLYQSFALETPHVLDINSVEIWFENKLVKELKKEEGSFRINRIENAVEFHSEDYLQWSGAEVYAKGVLKTWGEKGNLERNQLHYRGEDKNLFENCSNIIPADGGKNPESFEELKLRIPELLRSQDKVITAMDYEITAEKFSNMINRVKARYNFEKNQVELFVLPEAHKISSEQWKGLTISLQKFLQKKSVVNTSIIIEKPEIKKIKTVIVMSVKRNVRSREELMYRIREFIQNRIQPYKRKDYPGWGFGKTIKNSIIISMLYRFPEVAFVQEVLLYERIPHGWSEPRIQIELEENQLPMLEQIDIQIAETNGVWNEEIYEF